VTTKLLRFGSERANLHCLRRVQPPQRLRPLRPHAGAHRRAGQRAR
jgi:hypothetical protein